MLLPGSLSRLGEGWGEGDHSAITDFVRQSSLTVHRESGGSYDDTRNK
jgi:hypothetical protein